MSAAGTSGPESMRFALHEVLAGMLASSERDSFTDDAERLAAVFEQLAGRYSLFAPLAAGVDPQAVNEALEALEQKSFIEHGDGHYVLTEAGRAHCVSSKRMLFNQGDREQLEEAAQHFDTV